MKLKILALLILLKSICSSRKEICNEPDNDFAQHILINYLPIGLANQSVKIVSEIKLGEVSDCIKYCCSHNTCDAILFNNTQCSLIHCENDSLCKPIKENSDQPDRYYVFINSKENPKLNEKKENIDEGISSCEIGVSNNCRENQICNQIQENRRNGICLCKSGYTKEGNECVKEIIRESNKTEIEKSTNLPKNNTVAYIKNITQSSILLSSIKPTSIKSIKEKGKMPKTYSLVANAGADMNIYVLKSSLFDKPEIILLQGVATIDNRTVLSETLLYNWKRLPESVAAGTIANDSQNKSMLILTNLIQGQYLFELTVTSPDGNFAKDVVKLNVIETENEIDLNLVKIILETNIYRFFEKEKENFSKRMAHIIGKQFSFSKTIVQIHSVAPHYKNNTRIMFYAKMFNKTMNKFQLISSGLLERNLRNKILNHKFIFDYSVESFQSLFCHNDCGGHGSCDQNSHRCHCFFPWFNNGYHEHKTGFSNCDMHVMIVVVSCAIGMFFLVIIFILCKKIIKKLRLRSKYGKKVLQYRLLDDTDS